MGMVDAYKKGTLTSPSAEVKEVAEHIKAKDAHDFAATKHKGLPVRKHKAKKVSHTFRYHER